MATDPHPCGIIERGAAQPPVIEQETTGLDQIDLDREARGEAQQSAGILRDIGLEQGEAQIGLFREGLRTYRAHYRNAHEAGQAAVLCGSLSHSSASSSV